MLSYPEGELDKYVETALQKLRTSIYDELPEDKSNLSIQLYLARQKHVIGKGTSVLVVNITKESIDFKMRSHLNDYNSKSTEKSKKIIKTVMKVIKEILKWIAEAIKIAASAV